jgi:predicted RNA polymerase sigma factor
MRCSGGAHWRPRAVTRGELVRVQAPRRIMSLYDALTAIRQSPIVALNPAIAIAECDGPERGLAPIETIEGRDRLVAYPAALGEMALRRGDLSAAVAQFRAALKLARNPMERSFLKRKIAACDESGPIPAIPLSYSQDG